MAMEMCLNSFFCYISFEKFFPFISFKYRMVSSQCRINCHFFFKFLKFFFIFRQVWYFFIFCSRLIESKGEVSEIILVTSFTMPGVSSFQNFFLVFDSQEEFQPFFNSFPFCFYASDFQHLGHQLVIDHYVGSHDIHNVYKETKSYTSITLSAIYGVLCKTNTR